MDKGVDKFSLLEAYMLKEVEKLKAIKQEMVTDKDNFTQPQFDALISRVSGQIDILYKCLTAYDNTYNQDSQRKLSQTPQKD